MSGVIATGNAGGIERVGAMGGVTAPVGIPGRRVMDGTSGKNGGDGGSDVIGGDVGDFDSEEAVTSSNSNLSKRSTGEDWVRELDTHVRENNRAKASPDGGDFLLFPCPFVFSHHCPLLLSFFRSRSRFSCSAVVNDVFVVVVVLLQLCFSVVSVLCVVLFLFGVVCAQVLVVIAFCSPPVGHASVVQFFDFLFPASNVDLRNPSSNFLCLWLVQNHPTTSPINRFGIIRQAQDVASQTTTAPIESQPTTDTISTVEILRNLLQMNQLIFGS